MEKQREIQQLFDKYKQTSEFRKAIYIQILQIEERKAKLQKELDQLRKLYDQSIEDSDLISDQIDNILQNDQDNKEITKIIPKN